MWSAIRGRASSAPDAAERSRRGGARKLRQNAGRVFADRPLFCADRVTNYKKWPSKLPTRERDVVHLRRGTGPRIEVVIGGNSQRRPNAGKNALEVATCHFVKSF
jgi:hypothetical protein